MDERLRKELLRSELKERNKGKKIIRCKYKPKYPDSAEREYGIKLSGVKKITVHCTRHSHASMLVQMGFSPVEIAKRLGHGKVTTTIETYCHQSMDAQEKIADRLGKVERGEESGV